MRQSLKQLDGYAETHGACNVCIVYRRTDWDKFLKEAHPGNVMIDGFDCHMARVFKQKWHPDAPFLTLTPSVAYHAGFTGTHVFGQDLNVDYIGDKDNIHVE